MEKPSGLVGDLWPILQLMKATGMWIFRYNDDYGFAVWLIRTCWATIITLLVLSQYAFITCRLVMELVFNKSSASSAVTLMFFSNCMTKYIIFALRSKLFYETLEFWNEFNTHPLFEESLARHRAAAKKRMFEHSRMIGGLTIVTVFIWTLFSVRYTVDVPTGTTNGSTFLNNNETFPSDVQGLLIRSYHVWDLNSGWKFTMTFFYQFAYLLFSLTHANLMDAMLCCLLIYCCEELKHLKSIIPSLVKLSNAIGEAPSDDTENFRRATHSADSIRGSIFVTDRSSATTKIFTHLELKKNEAYTKSAIRYWVEYHKKIVIFVNLVGSCFGYILLVHMLVSTGALTILAYQAAQIRVTEPNAWAIAGYIIYFLVQVFIYCNFGNDLIDESGSVMEAAYGTQWYDGSEQAKTFVQIVCQQCQKPLVLSGARYFSVSLDLFASVVGAFVTYYMVLIQLN